jgi:hypothetical protein
MDPAGSVQPGVVAGMAATPTINSARKTLFPSFLIIGPNTSRYIDN